MGLRARGFDNSAVGGELNLLLEILNRLGRGVVVPVTAAGNNKLLPDVGAEETKVLQVDAAVRKNELGDQRRNTRVEADVSAGDAAKVEAKVTETRVELIQNENLALNVAELSQDEPMFGEHQYNHHQEREDLLLGKLLHDCELLLDEQNLRSLTNRRLVDKNDLLVTETIEVSRAKEVVEAVQRRKASPVVEGDNIRQSAVH